MTEYPADAGVRIDVFLSEKTGLTRSAVKKLANEGHVFADGVPVKAGHVLKAGSLVAVDIPAPVPIEAQPEDIPIDIVYEDEDIAVVNKPRGMAVHAGAGVTSGTLVNALLFHLHSLSGIWSSPRTTRRTSRSRGRSRKNLPTANISPCSRASSRRSAAGCIPSSGGTPRTG